MFSYFFIAHVGTCSSKCHIVNADITLRLVGWSSQYCGQTVGMIKMPLDFGLTWVQSALCLMGVWKSLQILW